MSILIKGMEMPKNCEKCPFGKAKKLDIGVVCTLLNVSFDVLHRPISMCPLIEVPPHGDLIDRDALTTVTEMVNGEFKTYIEVFEVVDAPTIIEADNSLLSNDFNLVAYLGEEK